MLGFLKRRRFEREARTRIGVQLHRQIKEAFDLNEREASARLQTSFITGVSEERATERHLRHICDGVLHNKLYEILIRQLAALEVAQSMSDQDSKIPGSGISPAESSRLFEIGRKAGFSDPACFIPFHGKAANNLKKYLLGDELDHRPLDEF